jgi:endo-1,4-beta-xylanase
MKKYTSLLIVLVSIICGCSSKKGQVTPTVPDTTASKGLYTYANFPVGASINVDLLRNNAVYTALVTKQYNGVTAENAMKFGYVHPAENTYNYTDADYLVTFAQKTGKRVHGHNLVWYIGLPDWVTNFQGDSTAWEQMLKSHIQSVVTHFKGKVVSWDVVNEGLNDDGTPRQSIWEQHLGSDYIARCYQYAHEADPDALLFYNDYGNEYSLPKRTAIINLVNGLKQRGIPIDGVGIQMHTNSNTSDQDIAAAITVTAASTGLKIHVSELDITMNPNNIQTMTFTSAVASAQAVKYKALVKVYNSLPAAQKFGITTWDVSDADSWIAGYYKRPDWPLPFNNLYLPKPAYQAIIDGLN